MCAPAVARSPPRSATTVASTRAFSPTTCRARRRSGSGSIARAPRELGDRHVAQRARAEPPRRLFALARGARCMPIRRARASRPSRRSRSPPRRGSGTGVTSSVRQSISSAWSRTPSARRELVHDPAAQPDEAVLRLLRGVGELVRRERRRPTPRAARGRPPARSAADDDSPAPIGTVVAQRDVRAGERNASCERERDAARVVAPRAGAGAGRDRRDRTPRSRSRPANARARGGRRAAPRRRRSRGRSPAAARSLRCSRRARRSG